MNPTIDVERARRETRGVERVVHLNNAGASLMPAPVADCLHDYLRDEERRGGYETAEARSDELERFYAALASLLGCAPDEIAYVENATRAWDMAFYSFRFAPGDRILTAVDEYGSNVIGCLHQAERSGAELVYVPNDADGQIDLDALEALVDERVKLISVSHVPTGGGLVNPAAGVGAIARRAGVPFLLDACQSAGQMPLDVDAIGCDILSGTGRKYLRGPRGTGFLYVRRSFVERLDPPFLDQHAAELVSPSAFRVRGDARRFENWEQNFAGKAALGVAVDYALAHGLEAIRDRIYALAADLRTRLEALDAVSVTDRGAERCGLVTFTLDGVGAEAVKEALGRARINVSVSSGSGNLVSYRERGLDAAVRASVHYFNVEEELDALVGTVRSLRG